MNSAVPLTLNAPRQSHQLVLAAVGDVMLDRYVGRRIDQFGPGYPLGEVSSELQKADLVIANLECPLTTALPTLKKRFVFRAKPAHVAALKGIDIVSVANNHTLDSGQAGFAETVRTLKGASIAAVGAEGWKPLILRRNGLKIAIFAFSDFPEKAAPIPAVPYYDAARMKAALAFIRPQVDDVVVFAHWGIEGTAVPSDRQRKEAKEMADAGADLILGSHPHVLQPVELIGHTVVAYSMGNFVFDAPNAAQSTTAIFRFWLGRNGVEKFDLTPCRIVACRPVPAPSAR